MNEVTKRTDKEREVKIIINKMKRKKKIKKIRRIKRRIIYFTLILVLVVVKFLLFPLLHDDKKTITSNNIPKAKIKTDVIEMTNEESDSYNSNLEKVQAKESKYAFTANLLSLNDTIIEKNGRFVVTNPSDITVITNKERALPSDFIPDDLVVPDVPFPFDEFHPKKQLRKEAADALEDLFRNAQEANCNLYALSGYRSYKTQETLFNESINIEGYDHANKFLAKPGYSEHQTGLSMDVTTEDVDFDVVQEFENTKEGKWLKHNCHKYGFIIRYPKDKEDITKYSYEPWHIRYVGEDISEVMNEENLCLEEFYKKYVSQ